MKKFICKWDWLNLILSLTLGFATFFVPYILHAAIRNEQYITIIWFAILCLILLISCYKALYLCPTSMELDEETLTIKHLIGSEVLKRDEFTAVKANKDFSIMNFYYDSYFSNARPLFGYWGNFHNSKGKFRFCFTHRKQDLWILTLKGDERKLIINAPADWFKEEQ